MITYGETTHDGQARTMSGQLSGQGPKADGHGQGSIEPSVCPRGSRTKGHQVTNRTSRGGRPSSATPELKREILERMAEGESLRAICLSDGMPSRTSVARWLDEDENFRGQYARARELRADHIADLVHETAMASTPETAHADRVKIDALKWEAGKLNSKRYGDKVQHTGSDGESPIQTNLTVTFVKAGEEYRQQKLIEGEWRDDDAADEAE